jgi:hypothetical protein
MQQFIQDGSETDQLVFADYMEDRGFESLAAALRDDVANPLDDSEWHWELRDDAAAAADGSVGVGVGVGGRVGVVGAAVGVVGAAVGVVVGVGVGVVGVVVGGGGDGVVGG